MTRNSKYKLVLMMLIGLWFAGCINVDQKTTINEDGSGTILLEYWVNSNLVNVGGGVSMGDEIAGYSFIAEEIKKKYASAFSEVRSVRKNDFPADTTTHIIVDIGFKDFNKITDMQGFSNTEASYTKGEDNTKFRYFIPIDTTIKLNYTTDKHTLEYTFTFPHEVIETNGTKDPNAKDGNVVKWKFLTSDHAKKDIELTATVKNKFKLCGMFGIELPMVLMFGLIYFNFNRRKKRKQNNLS